MRFFHFRSTLALLLTLAMLLCTSASSEVVLELDDNSATLNIPAEEGLALDQPFDALEVPDLENIELSLSTLMEDADSVESPATALNVPGEEPADANDGAGWPVPIDADNFPAKEFRNYVKQNIDKNGDNKLSKKEAGAVDSIHLRTEEDLDNGENEIDCPNMKGLEYFANLSELECTGCNLSSLDVSGNKHLEILIIIDNKLKTLDVSNNPELVSISLRKNQLTKLDVSKCTKLETLDCQKNKIKTLKLPAGDALEYLIFNGNPLTSLDASTYPNLKELHCYECPNLKSLKLGDAARLVQLYAWDCKLTSLDLSKSVKLEALCCQNNQLKTLKLPRNASLSDFHCEDNKLTSLDASGNKKLKYLSCNNNKLTSLNLSGCKKMKDINSRDNSLTELDVSDRTTVFHRWI